MICRSTFLLTLSLAISPVLHATTNPTPLEYANGTVELFTVRSDGNVWHNLQTTSSGTGFTAWSGWVSLGSAGGGFSQSPAVIFDPNQQAEMFATGNDGNLYQCMWQSGTSTGWGSWTSLGSPAGNAFKLAPAVIINPSNGLELFIVASDGNLYHRWWTSNTANSWSSGWTSLGNGGSSFPAAATVVLNPSHNLQVFAVGTEGNAYNKQYASPAGWGAWTLLAYPGQPFVGTPAVLINPGGVLEQFLIAKDGMVWASWQQTGTSTGWSAWQFLNGYLGGPTLQGSPTAILAQGGTEIVVDAVGSDGNLYHTYTSMTNWTQWYYWSSIGNPGINLVTNAVPILINGGMALFDVAVDGNIYYAQQGTFDDTYNWWGWSSWFVTLPFTPTAPAVQEYVYFGNSVAALENH